MGTLGVDLGMGESFNETADPSNAAAEGGNATGITPFSADFCEEQVLVAKLVHLLIHDNTDIDYRMLVIARKHLCKGPEKSLFYTITCLVLFIASLSHRVMSLPLTLFRLFTFTHLSSSLKKGMIW